MEKIGLLIKALGGKVTDHHRFLLKMHFEHIDSISSQIALLDEKIYQKLEIHNKEFELIRTVPGINAITGASIIAEIGVDPVSVSKRTSPRILGGNVSGE